MKNDSGTAFNNAKVKLMAGDVNKVQPQPQPQSVTALKSLGKASDMFGFLTTSPL